MDTDKNVNHGITQRNDMWYLSYQQRHILADNLATRNAIVHSIPPYNNSNYCMSVVILQGSMNLKVNGVSLVLHPNDYLVVMPCSNIEVKESRCVFFSQTILAHACFDLYEELNYNVPVQKRAFCFHYYHFSGAQVERLKEVYLMVKRELMRADYQMKDIAVRSLSKLCLVSLKEVLITSPDGVLVPYEMTRQQQVFDRFIELLDIHYTHERSVQYYANKLGVTSKYLSMLSKMTVGTTSSAVINQYVTFRVKQLLYRGQLNVKQISQLLNFPTQSFFGRYFKRVVGCSPRQYMKQNNRNFNIKKAL